ncbi:MAG: 23S rRNA (pseudouridine(1915)-N(3))-methyltransferase RlmH [Erysipelotrichaceae bacterium]|nr:23S rRNA (pseudouridine(1915)-N(3))-methyltransferase RlmH [Erysipelotrichaceae bacterium]
MLETMYNKCGGGDMKLICVGKVKEKALRSLIEEYQKRLQPYTKLEIVEVEDGMAPQSNSEAQNELVKEKEGQQILSKIKEKEFVILLDLWGKMMSSEQLAQKMEEYQAYHGSQITFVIGGSLGLSPAVVQRADVRWKLSDLTFPHQIVRLLVLEQIYRSFKILKNEPYHK